MRPLPLSVRAALAVVVVVCITAWGISLFQRAAIARFRSRPAGQLIEQFKHVAPQIERRDRELDELTPH